jgi:hypothetical protein
MQADSEGAGVAQAEGARTSPTSETARARAGERQAALRDELNEPLGTGPGRPASAPKGRAGVFAAVAAGIAAAAVAGEWSLLSDAAASRARAAVVMERYGAPVERPPLRLTETFDAPPQASPAAAPAKSAVKAPPAGPARLRAGAPEPLIIDVQQALAAQRARSEAAASP